MLEAVLWENPTYGISGRAAGNVAHGGNVNPSRNRKGEAGNPPPTGARASALPDSFSPPKVGGAGAALEVVQAPGGCSSPGSKPERRVVPPSEGNEARWEGRREVGVR